MSGNMVTSIFAEQKRCRTLIEQYKSIGPAGTFGKLMIQQEIDEADKALASGDTLKMIAALQALRGCS